MNKVAGILKQDTAVSYYRIGQPIMFMKTKEKSRITPFTGRNNPISLVEKENAVVWSDKTLMEICKDADVIWSTVIYDLEEMTKILNLRKWSGAKWIVDMDDNLYAVSNDNPGQINTKLLRDNFELCLKVCDGVTVSVPMLKKLYEPLNKNIYVNPNGTDLSWWGKVKAHKGIRIGWRGAYGHKSDVELIEPVIKALKKDYDFTFVSYGVKPPFESEHHEWTNFLKDPNNSKSVDYPTKLASLNLDIALVPLIDSSYNRCKSNLAIQEFSSLRIPVVASPTENQKNMPVSYASTNFEWYEQIEKLLKSKTLRERQGQKQYDFVKANYSQEKLIKSLMGWMEKLPRKEI